MKIDNMAHFQLSNKVLGYLKEISELKGIKRLVALPEAHMKNKYLKYPYKITVPSSVVISSSKDQIYPQLKSRGIGCGMVLFSTQKEYEESDKKLLEKTLKVIGSTNDIFRVFNVPKKAINFVSTKLKNRNYFSFEDKYSIEPNNWERLIYEGPIGYLKYKNRGSKEIKGVKKSFEGKGNHYQIKTKLTKTILNKKWMSGKYNEFSTIWAGRLFGGNHFLEAQKIVNLNNQKLAKKFGLFENQIMFLAHCCGDALENILSEKFVKNQIMLPYYNKIERGSKDYETILKAVSLLRNYGSMKRTALFMRLNDILKSVFGEQEQISPITESTHNNIQVKPSQLVYRHNCFEIKKNRISIISGRFDHPSYIITAGKNAKRSIYSTDHGIGTSLKNENGTKSKKESIILTRDRYITQKFKKTKTTIWNFSPGEKVVEDLEEKGIIKIIAKTEPIITLKYSGG